MYPDLMVLGASGRRCSVEAVRGSATFKDLVVGSGIEFLPGGTFDLTGVPGSWQLHQPRCG